MLDATSRGSRAWPLALARSVLAAGLVAALLLAGCGSAPTSRAGASDRDGPMAETPADLERVPDAQPRLERIRSGGPNKPYVVNGRSYTPETRDAPMRERGLASWYGRKFHGRPTSTGEPYDMFAMSAAHPTMPLPSYARVRNPANGLEVIVRINDRGPFHPGRVIDLSYTAALKLRLLRGVGIVEVERITYDDIRSGAWKRGGEEAAPVVAQPAPPMPAGAAPPAPEPDLPLPAAPAAAPTAEAAPAAVAASYADAARGYWVQLGAFRQRDGALSFQQRIAGELDWIAPLLSVFDDNSVHRLQAGPYPNRQEASGAADRLREALSLVPVIVERR